MKNGRGSIGSQNHGNIRELSQKMIFGGRFWSTMRGLIIAIEARYWNGISVEGYICGCMFRLCVTDDFDIVHYDRLYF